jgi:hypothetical protein
MRLISYSKDIPDWIFDKGDIINRFHVLAFIPPDSIMKRFFVGWLIRGKKWYLNVITKENLKHYF